MIYITATPTINYTSMGVWATVGVRRLGRASRIGLGLAAVGRPGYINLGRERDLPADRSVEALRRRSADLLDEAYRRGVRYVGVARSYGRAEEFVAGWLPGHPDMVVGSKWGYEYTAGWRIDADVHERKQHGVEMFERQLADTRSLLGDRLDLYQIHSVTLDSGALADRALHRRLASLARDGVTIGFSTSGPAQAEVIRAALAVEVDGEPLFGAVQATWNVLEPSAGPALAQAHAGGRFVIVKEAMANGRLAAPGSPLAEPALEHGVGADAVALAAVLANPWVDVVLSGAATLEQLTSNLAAEGLDLSSAPLESYAQRPADYWRTRSALPWH
jgi:aryl-alcohol dehydrogenase-like predicted oxidoreductase